MIALPSQPVAAKTQATGRAPCTRGGAPLRWLGYATLASLIWIGCNPYNNGPLPDAGSDVIDLHGRVVDFESCPTWDRCAAIEGAEVRLRTLPAYVSEPTTGPGRFLLTVPRGYEDDLLVDDAGTLADSYAPTLNPWAAPPAISDVFDIELHALPRGTTDAGHPTIVAAMAALPGSQGADLIDDGGYVGQVLRRDSDGLHAVLGARVDVLLPSDWPSHVAAPQVRFVQDVEAGAIFYGADYRATGGPGIFVIPTAGQSAFLTIRVQAGETIFTEVIAPVMPGMVTLGMHYP